MPAASTRLPVPSTLPADMAPAVSEFLDYLQAECGLAGNTRQAYRRDLIGFGSFLIDAGCRSLRKITCRRIEEFRIDQAGMSCASRGLFRRSRWPNPESPIGPRR